jgi:formylglycine-generating enzyme required for sulfatase activity
LTTSSFTLPLLEWIDIPAGIVTLEKGWNAQKHHYSLKKLAEYPVEPFSISKYPVTNAQFDAFIKDGGYSNDRWWQGLSRIEKPKRGRWITKSHPRERVTWYEAMAFCRWLSDKLGEVINLPTEIQWQRAAQGNDGREYPWGNDPIQANANTRENGLKKTAPVTQYPQGVSPYGVKDMIGNVWELTLNSAANPEIIASTEVPAIIRGGSWFNDLDISKTTVRGLFHPTYEDHNVGFRLVK